MNVHAASAMNKNEIADKPEKKEWNWMPLELAAWRLNEPN